MPRRWTIRPVPPEADRLARALGLLPLVARVLANRGLASPQAARAFLNPDLSQLHEPASDPAILAAADRLVAAARNGEPIVIYGDYDADGITASAILWQALRLADADVRIYTPHRLEEGYGLNRDAIGRLAAEGARVLVTVDCGITSAAEVAHARALGLETIITDHHEPDPDRIPEATVIVNPKLPGSPYPFRDLSGAGLALKLAWAIGQRLSRRDRVTDAFREFLVAATALAALGTIADVVPLVGENHALAGFGLRALAASRHPGIGALLEVSGLADKRLDAGHVGFMLAPRLNAAGRMGSAREAIELLTTAGPEAALAIAQKLDRLNRKRQQTEKQIFEEAEARIAETFDKKRDAAIVLASEGWHAGVIGIVASRIVEKYWRPTVLIAVAEDHAQGSGRSISGFDLFGALAACGKHLKRYGGHAMAAGLQLSPANVPAFREAFLAHAGASLRPEDLVPRVTVDAEVKLSDLTLEAARALERLGPFGAGNPRPVFAARRLRLVKDARQIGRRGAHLAFRVTEGGHARRAVAWRGGEAADALSRAGSCGIAFTLRISDYRATPEVELHVKDLWIGSYEDPEAAREYA
ncbi:MAG: single-stranded-DNA-specific exonuclease RecJ [Phycisphaerae bacterium]